MYRDLSPLILLDNGLKLILHHHPDEPGIHIRANVRMGSCDERLPRDKGICNLIERLCWRGSEKMSLKKVAENSAIGGSLTGGSVGRTFTTYHTWCPTNQLTNGLDLLDNIIFRPKMDADDLEIEKRLAIMRIVSEECDPVIHATQVALTNLYPKHRLAFGMLGTPETVTNMKVTRMRELVRGSHRPQTMALGLSGDLPPFEKLEGILGKHAGGFVEKTRAANAIPLDREWGDGTPVVGGQESETWGYREDWTTVIIVPVPSGILREDGQVIMTTICKLIGCGPASLLWQKLIYTPKTPIVHDIRADFGWFDGVAWLRIIINSSGERGGDIPKLAENILFGPLVQNLKDDQLTSAKAAVRADLADTNSDPRAKLASDMEWLSIDTVRWSPDMDLPWIDDLDPNDLRETVRAMFANNSASICNIMR